MNHLRAQTFNFFFTRAPSGQEGFVVFCAFLFRKKRLDGEIFVEVGLANEDLIFCENQNVDSRYTLFLELGGGFKYFLFSPLFGEDSNSD